MVLEIRYIDYNGKLSKDEKELMKQIMLNRRKKHWSEKKKYNLDGWNASYI